MIGLAEGVTDKWLVVTEILPNRLCCTGSLDQYSATTLLELAAIVFIPGEIARNQMLRILISLQLLVRMMADTMLGSSIASSMPVTFWAIAPSIMALMKLWKTPNIATESLPN